MIISEIKPNMIVRGSIFPEPVKVITAIPMGDSIKLIDEGMVTEKVHQPILKEDQVAQLEVSSEKEPFDGDPVKFRLGIEALRLGLAYEYDPYFSLSIARVDPLPHQLEEVANLSFQWQRELKDKFRENFQLIRSDVLRATYGANPWQDINQIITSISWISRIEDARESLMQSRWDLIIVDEAHKMSAYSEEKKTLAYKLGESLSDMTDHYLLKQ